jgi:Fe-S cluster assembly protein SufD
MEVFPDLIENIWAKRQYLEQPGLVALNTAFFQDGLFIYVPENTEVEKPIQLINIVDSPDPVMVQPRYLIIQEKNSKLTLVHCDHSLTHNLSFTNTVSETFLAEGALS